MTAGRGVHAPHLVEAVERVLRVHNQHCASVPVPLKAMITAVSSPPLMSTYGPTIWPAIDALYTSSPSISATALQPADVNPPWSASNAEPPRKSSPAGRTPPSWSPFQQT
eukprot:3230748-Pyramimonas_sp.AAC.1